jgi:hypothetical protein
MEIEYTAYNDEAEEERTYTIEYSYYGGCKGTWDDPGDEPEVEILSVTDEDDNDVDEDDVFSSDDFDEIYSKCFADAEDCIEDAKSEAAISRYEDEQSRW